MATLEEILKLDSISQVSDPKKSSEALPQTKVAIIAPRDEHYSRTYQIPNRIYSNQKFNRNICPDASQRLNRFRRMLITRSDDGDFGRNPDT